MPSYTFRSTKTDETKDVRCSVSEYDDLVKEMERTGWVRIIKPVAIKDSGTGR